MIKAAHHKNAIRAIAVLFAGILIFFFSSVSASAEETDQGIPDEFQNYDSEQANPMAGCSMVIYRSLERVEKSYIIIVGNYAQHLPTDAVMLDVYLSFGGVQKADDGSEYLIDPIPFKNESEIDLPANKIGEGLTLSYTYYFPGKGNEEISYMECVTRRIEPCHIGIKAPKVTHLSGASSALYTGSDMPFLIEWGEYPDHPEMPADTDILQIKVRGVFPFPDDLSTVEKDMFAPQQGTGYFVEGNVLTLSADWLDLIFFGDDMAEYRLWGDMEMTDILIEACFNGAYGGPHSYDNLFEQLLTIERGTGQGHQRAASGGSPNSDDSISQTMDDAVSGENTAPAPKRNMAPFVVAGIVVIAGIAGGAVVFLRKRKP